MEEEYKFEDDGDSESNEKLNEKDYEDLTTYTSTHNVRVIVDMIDEGIIDLKPEFQRDFVWDIRKSSKLIDSLILSIPIPNILLARSKSDEKFIVIDGQQRLKSLYYFIKKKKFPFRSGEIEFKLKGLENNSWNGKGFDELEETIQRKIMNTTINATSVDYKGEIPKLIFELFNRLNTGGVRLTSQEVRNCIYQGYLNLELKKLNLNNNWRILFGDGNPNKRMNDIELILRFYSLYNERYKSYNSPMRKWLNDFMFNNIDNKEEFESFKNIFELTMGEILGKVGSEAFKRRGRNFNRAIFDSLVVAVSSGIQNESLKDNLKEEVEELVNLYEFQSALIEGSTDPRKVKLRINLAKQHLCQNVQQ